MRASPKLGLRYSLSPLVIALVLAAPWALAKKDLFANDPASRQNHPTENLVSTSSSSSATEIKNNQQTNSSSSASGETPENFDSEKEPDEKKPSYLETQFTRFKGHLVEVKNDLFGGEKTSSKKISSTQLQQEQGLTDGSHSSEDSVADVPTISSTQAAQRAQTFAEGQVINVRKYQAEERVRYAVKLLQKNGRMKTVNLDAVTGDLVEEELQ